MKEIHYEGITQFPKEFLKNRTLMSSLGKAEAEEVLSRILRFCLDINKWIAPTDEELDAQVKADLIKIRKSREIRQRNWEKERLYNQKKRSFFRRLLKLEPKKPVYEEEIPAPSTFLTMDGNALHVGINYMLAKGFLKILTENGKRYFMATEKALRRMPVR